jgi:HAMP domain-containing protein
MAPRGRTAIARAAAGSLGTRIFLLSGALITASVATAVVFTMLRAHQVAGEAVDRALDASQAAQESFEHEREQQLRLISRVVASDPSFVAYVAEADPASIRDLLEQRRQALGCDFVIVLDRQGRVLARTDRPGGAGADLSGHPLVAEALARGEAAEVWHEDERLATAVAVPLLSGQQVVEGILVAAFALDDRLAVLLKRATDAEVAFLSLENGVAHVAASTLESSGDALVGALASADGALARVAKGEGVARLEFRLGGRAWVARLEPLRDAGRSTVGVAAMLTPLDRHIGAFRSIAGALAVAGAFGVLGAFVLSYTLSRRVTRPIERLAEAAEAARAGEFAAVLPTEGTDEVGRLARAFRGLLGELREQCEMEEYLSRLSREMPEASVDETSGERAQPTLARGALLGGRFEVLEAVGAGGNGVVYRARDRAIRDVVALKVLDRQRLGDAEALERLKSELRMARRVTHRHVIRTHDFGELDGVAFISMEYVRGTTLRQLLRLGALPLAAAMRISRQLLAGLEAAHAMDVLHGDLKPENLLIEPNGNVKLADFGISRPLRRGPPRDEVTLAGTLHYLAPEQLMGREPDVRADLYAVGVLLFEMLTGRKPFAEATTEELTYHQLNLDPPGPRALRPEIPLALDEIVLACLARDPALRPPSATALRERLARTESWTAPA